VYKKRFIINSMEKSPSNLIVLQFVKKLLAYFHFRIYKNRPLLLIQIQNNPFLILLLFLRYSLASQFHIISVLTTNTTGMALVRNIN
jgi:hypothetical protein